MIRSSEPGTDVLQQTQLLTVGIPLLYFIPEAATEEVEQNFVQIFVNGPEVVSNTREYLDRGSSQDLETRVY